MLSETTVVDQQFEETVRSLFEDADSVLIVNPAPPVFRALILTAVESDIDLPDLKVLASSEVLKSAVEDFILASRVADLVEQEVLTLRTTSDIARNSLLVSEDLVVTVITLDGKLTGLQSSDEELVENVRTTFMDEWETGDTFSLRTPPFSRVKETLDEDFGEDVKDDFMMIVESVDTIPGEDDELDEVAIALLVGANNEELLYDISKWGEDTGVASKATFSRTKTRLEDRGLIETEKVPIDVGRPRLRLVLVPNDLQDIDNLAEQVTA
ncbi:DUF5821 family protein [Haladaptatus sp. T7]|uniref:transcriptional regulator TbsP n=1 Tax=Haladaptatus sp. T7 TaxID=2029368 RepID=UPI0021A256AF|nr:DUF5821 family protein [Haladaptatus sp. T7]GKZ14487.1 hypothetical protein HAL_23680 [Haladaptatus sp. T7]